jgi:two-component system phosphate regulon response regulator PhoB
MRVAIVDDKRENLLLYKEILSDTFTLDLFDCPKKFLEFIRYEKSDLVILDLHMPELNGFDVYNHFKKYQPQLPVIFLSGDPSEESLIEGLELGAVDFIVKPVSPKELIARVKNKINTKSFDIPKKKIISLILDDLEIDCESQVAKVGSESHSLTPTEFKILYFFVTNPNIVFSREYITNLIWPTTHVQEQVFDTHFSNLRKKLHPFSTRLVTIKGRGYIFKPTQLSEPVK